MNIKMIAFLTTVLVALSAPAFAVSKADAGSRQSDSIRLASGGRLHSWRAVTQDELIIWASLSRPYLVKIQRPFSSMRFVNYVGVTSFGGRVTEFDQVIVDGQRLPIRSIVALDRETAKDLRWTKSADKRTD